MPVLNSSPGDTAPLPIRLRSARELGEMALQKIGAFTTNDEAADSNELERTLEWMETEIGHLSGVHRLQWLIRETLEFDLEDDVAEYDLADVMGSAYPSLGIAYPIAAYIGTLNYNVNRGAWVTGAVYALNDLVTFGGAYYLAASAHTAGTFATDLTAVKWVLQPATSFDEIPILRRAQYESYPDKLTAGTPDGIYIDRMNDNKNLLVYPVQSSSVNTRLRLVVQTYPRSVMGQGAQNTGGDVSHGFPVEWQKWIIHATAAVIGDGPVRRLDANTLKDIRATAGQGLIDLMSSQSREKITHRLHRTRRWGP